MIKIFEAFSGYGSQSLALRNTGLDYRIVGISEIDSSAIKAHEILHGKVENFGDITKINYNDIPDHDLFTYSFPCQDISASGKNASFEEGSGTRSSLLWECRKIIECKKPKYLLMENVKNILNKNHKQFFLKWVEVLESMGYNNFYDVYNSKDYGIPQNRERVFMVSILGEDSNFVKPQKRDNMVQLSDIIEKNVPDSLYVSSLQRVSDENNVAQLVDFTKLCPNFMHKGIHEVKTPCIVASRGRNPQNTSSRTSGIPTVQVIEPNTKGVSNTLTTVLKDNYVLMPDGKIRNLSVRECFRLMGVSDKDIDKLLVSDLKETNLYKLAGNSIVVQVMEDIFKSIFIDE